MSEKFKILNALMRKGPIFTFEDAQKVSGLKRESLRVLLSRMEKEGWIERIERGKYLIIPLGAEKGKHTVHEFVIASALIEPAVISYWSALNYHGLTEQIPGTVFIQSTGRKNRQELEVFGVRYKIIKVKEEKLFGIERVWIEGNLVLITDPEKTIVDCLENPKYCGGIIEVAKALEEDINIERVLEYAKRTGNSAVIKRLGYLCEQLGISIKIPEEDLAKGYPLLDPSAKDGGHFNRRWKILNNLDEGMLEVLE